MTGWLTGWLLRAVEPTNSLKVSWLACDVASWLSVCLSVWLAVFTSFVCLSLYLFVLLYVVVCLAICLSLSVCSSPYSFFPYLRFCLNGSKTFQSFIFLVSFFSSTSSFLYKLSSFTHRSLSFLLITCIIVWPLFSMHFFPLLSFKLPLLLSISFYFPLTDSVFSSFFLPTYNFPNSAFSLFFFFILP